MDTLMSQSTKSKPQYLKARSKSGTTFSNNLKSEFGKIQWPTTPDVIKASIAILVFVVFFTSFVTFSDYLLAKLFFLIKGT